MPKAEAGTRLSMAEVMTNGSGSKVADVFQQVVISSFGQLAMPQLCYQLHYGFVVVGFGFFYRRVGKLQKCLQKSAPFGKDTCLVHILPRLRSSPGANV